MRTLILMLLLTTAAFAQTTEKAEVAAVLDKWHRDAAKGDGKAYFGAMTDESIYIGTDATENWSLDAFKAFSKPYFDKGQAWDFTAVERNIYFSADGKTAWFDELLDTWMKLCRGSGVLLKQKDGSWKIAHYVLSITIPNDNSLEVIKIKKAFDDAYLAKLKQKK